MRDARESARPRPSVRAHSEEECRRGRCDNSATTGGRPSRALCLRSFFAPGWGPSGFAHAMHGDRRVADGSITPGMMPAMNIRPTPTRL
jgi:hypothetical protein